MEGSSHQVACDGCGEDAKILVVAIGARLCESCRETSEKIDRMLVNVASDDPVSCDGCATRVDYDARVAVITRGCGGAVLCDRCSSPKRGSA